MLSGMVFAVIRERGRNWDDARPLREQAGWPEHAAYMDALTEEGWVLLGGPLSDGSRIHRALLIVEAADEAEVSARMDEDPWTPMQMLGPAAIHRWTVLLGELAGRA